MKITAKIMMCGCILLWKSLFAQDRTVTISSALKTLRQIEDLPRYIENTKLYQVSSYDTTGGNNDGFSGKYSFLRRNPDSSLVIFDAKGKGVINRIWTPTPTGDTLDFYFGKTRKPSFSIKFSDLFSGTVYPFTKPLSRNEVGGFFTYFPIPFKDGCRIVFRGKKLEFYQIQYRSYPQDYKVQNFSMGLSRSAKTEYEQLKTDWENIGNLNSVKQVITDTVMEPGWEAQLLSINKGGRILGLKIHDASSYEGLKNIDIRMTWDNEERPAVYMPVADFFGYAFGKTSMQSLLLGSKNDVNYCYFPMPFDKSAKIEMIYRPADSTAGDKPFHVKAEILLADNPRQPEKEGKFYTYWQGNERPPLGEPYVFLEGAGRGHYVGSILQAQGLNPGMTLFFEGDDVTTIDGQMRVHGTGSEDYFNGGWYALLNRWDRAISLPLHGSLDYSLPYARTGGYRLFLSDKMPFAKHIKHTIEHGPENNNVPVSYTSVAFYYSDGQVNKEQKKPSNAQTQTFVPDTFMVYPQLMKYTVAGNVNIDGEVLSSPNGGQVRIDLSEIPNGRYKLYADVEQWPEGGEVILWQRQKEVAHSISFYGENSKAEDGKFLCNIALDDFRSTLTIKFKNTDKSAKIRIKRLIFKADPD